MAVKPVPDGYQTVVPYLVSTGVEKLLVFLQASFGAKITQEPMRRSDGTIMHTEVQIGDSRVMMGEACDKAPAMPASMYLYVPNCDELYQNAMKAGATSIMEPTTQFYGDRNAGVKDPSGNTWWLATHVEDVSQEELKKRAAAMKPQPCNFTGMPACA